MTSRVPNTYGLGSVVSRFEIRNFGSVWIWLQSNCHRSPYHTVMIFIPIVLYSVFLSLSPALFSLFRLCLCLCLSVCLSLSLSLSLLVPSCLIPTTCKTDDRPNDNITVRLWQRSGRFGVGLKSVWRRDCGITCQLIRSSPEPWSNYFFKIIL